MDDTSQSDRRRKDGGNGNDNDGGGGDVAAAVYERKDDAYFGYYALLSHQAQMLQDAVRTSAYQRAILGHAADHFSGKTVIDVGAGNGILSLFALQAGADKVFAVEASNMVDYLKNLVRTARGEAPISSGVGDSEDEDDDWYLEAQGVIRRTAGSSSSTTTPPNPWIADRLVPVHSKVEDVTPAKLDGNDKVDTIVSECLGVLLVHERMCESFIDARDRFLKPGGAMFPSAGTICFAPFEDKTIWDEAATKARFWQNTSFYGVDVTPFFPAAWKEAFSSPVVGCFNAHTLIASTVEHLVDFQTISMAELKEFQIPLHWPIKNTGLIHGIGGWFDLHFQPPAGAAGGGDSTMADGSTATTSNSSAYGGMSVSAPPFQPTLDQNASSTLDPTSAASTLLAAAQAAAASSGQPTGLESLDSNAGNTSFMSTAPHCTPTHWQQARLLLPEPLAVNRGQVVMGSMRFKVNESRSYDIHADMWVEAGAAAASTTTTAPSAPPPSSSSSSRSTRRRFKWKLDRQTYSWTTSTVGQAL